MHKYRRVMFVAALLVVASCKFAVADYGESTRVYGNVECWARLTISGVDEDGDLISGTNVYLTASAGARSTAGPPMYDDAKFYRAELRMNGELVYEREYEVSLGGGGGGLFSFSFDPVGAEYFQDAQPPPVRFASTHFNHNTSVNIELRAYYALGSNGVWVETGTVTVQISPKAYNKLATWMATHWVNNGVEQPLPQVIQDDLVDYLANLRSGFAVAKYGLDGDDLDSSESSALAEIEVATATAPNTHGTSSGIQVSGPYANGFLTWSEIAAVTSDGEADFSPPHSIIILYACATFPAKVTIANSFRMNAIDGAYLGFPVIMSWDCDDTVNNQIVGSENWIRELLYHLNEGRTIKESLDRANDRYQPLDFGWNPIDMDLHGDQWATLTWVYLPPGEREGGLAGVYKQWFKVYDP